MEKENVPIWKRILVKLTSLKNLLAIWSAIMLSIIILKNLYEFKELGYGLLLVLAGYLGVNFAQKKIEK